MMRTSALAFLSVLLAMPLVAADTPKGELMGAYSVLNDRELDETFNVGFVASGAVYLSDSAALVGEVGGNYKTIEGIDLSVTTLMGGFKFAGHGSGATPFLQVLAGAARAKGSVGGLGVDVSATNTKFAVQPGIGLDLRLSDAVDLRIGGDYRRIFTEHEGTNEFRGYAGLVFKIGRK